MDTTPPSLLRRGLARPAAVAAPARRRRVTLVTGAHADDGATPLAPAARGLLALLAADGLLCLVAEGEAATLDRALRWEPDLVLMAGPAARAECVRRLVLLRERSAAPVVLLAHDPDASSDEQFLLEAGFDAVWFDPQPRLLQLRVHALLRARGGVQRRGPRVRVGALSIDSTSLTARSDGGLLALTRTQVQLLYALALAPEQMLSRADLASALVAVGGAPASETGSRNIDALVCRLRARLRAAGLEGIGLEPVRGHGYRLVVSERAATPTPVLRSSTPAGLQEEAGPVSSCA